METYLIELPDYLIYSLLIAAGFLSGVINTLAGSGSLITLPLLMVLGLPANVANGTNRINILLQSLVGWSSFKKAGVLDLKSSRYMIFPSIAGAIVGALIAVDLNEKIMERTIGGLLLFMFFIILWKPSRWLKEHQTRVPVSPVMQSLIFFLIGVYGGFIQAGVGFFLLAGLVLASGQDLVRANAMKLFLTFAFTPIALIIFILNGQVHYLYGFVLSAGSMAGAYFAAKMAVKWGAKFIHYVLLIVVFVSAVKLLGFF
jgi:uncharacterized membrane protein YfcA